MKHPLPTATVRGNDASHASTASSSGRQTKIDFSTRLMTDNRRRKITDLLVNFVVKDVRPISTLSGEGFKDIIQYFEPGYTIPCHRTVWSNIMHQYNTNYQKQLGVQVNSLQNDCATRWNSTFTMLERLYEQRIPVQAVLTDESITKVDVRKSLTIREHQWELIEQLILVLRPLAKATTIMCAELHVGLSFIYPVLLNVCDMLRVTGSDLGAIRYFKDMVRKELVKRFKLESDILADSIPITACLLDPRFKHLKFLPENIRADALAHLTQLVGEDEEQPATTDPGEGEADGGDNQSDFGKKTRLENDFEQLFGPHYEGAKSKRARMTNADELRDYHQLAHIPTMDNPLKWWAQNEGSFPRLAKLAKSYLAVPATSTPSERIFSLAGNTVTRQRSSLHPSHVDALVFLNANRKGNVNLIREQDID
ncbi:unnamed protein product [Leuciscus chuanchicus]